MPLMIGFSRCLAVGATLGLLAGCGSSTSKASAGAGGDTGSAGSSSSSAGSGPFGSEGGSDPGHVGSSTAAQVATKLGRPSRFMVGMGNDLNNDHSMDGAYTLGTT